MPTDPPPLRWEKCPECGESRDSDYEFPIFCPKGYDRFAPHLCPPRKFEEAPVVTDRLVPREYEADLKSEIPRDLGHSLKGYIVESLHLGLFRTVEFKHNGHTYRITRDPLSHFSSEDQVWIEGTATGPARPIIEGTCVQPPYGDGVTEAWPPTYHYPKRQERDLAAEAKAVREHPPIGYTRGQPPRWEAKELRQRLQEVMPKREDMGPYEQAQNDALIWLLLKIEDQE